MIFDVTDIPPGSKAVRIVNPGEHYSWDRGLIVTDQGETLYLQFWLGKPLSRAEWRSAAGELFPNARQVQFERWCKRTQAFRLVTLKLGTD